MLGNIIGLAACFLCAVPFLIVSIYGKDSYEPINFWSGDTTLKSKVKNVKEYNQGMAKLYKKCAFAFFIAGAGCLISLGIGIMIICLNCTFGFYLAYRSYKKILNHPF